MAVDVAFGCIRMLAILPFTSGASPTTDASGTENLIVRKTPFVLSRKLLTMKLVERKRHRYSRGVKPLYLESVETYPLRLTYGKAKQEHRYVFPTLKGGYTAKRKTGNC